MGLLMGEAFLFVFPSSGNDGLVTVSMWRGGRTTCVTIPAEIIRALLDNVEQLAALHAEHDESVRVECVVKDCPHLYHDSSAYHDA